MSPDINTMPAASRPPNSPLASSRRPRRMSLSTTDHTAHPGPPSPRSPSLSSLQAAATINAGLHRSPGSPSPVGNSLERRRSSLMNNISLNDPAIPAPGEMQTHNNGSPRAGRRSSFISGNTADPHHHRQPSLGELHQELEAETEGQVNRLLHMIRLQQDQLAALQGRQTDSSAISPTSELPTPPTTTTTTTTATSSRPSSAHPASRSPSFSSAAPQPSLPHGHGVFNRPHSLSRQNSGARASNTGSTNSHAASPALRPSSSSNLGPLTEDFLLGGTTRDDATFYQAETQMLTRENQMLKFRIRELGEFTCACRQIWNGKHC